MCIYYHQLRKTTATRIYSSIDPLCTREREHIYNCGHGRVIPPLARDSIVSRYMRRRRYIHVRLWHCLPAAVIYGHYGESDRLVCVSRSLYATIFMLLRMRVHKSKKVVYFTWPAIVLSLCYLIV